MANLLEKASIVLTPTSYNNGEALCIKPDDGSGDFQFSRNSAATRVNAQGLVENVQILSSNLVQNGDFSEEGAEEVSNGSFTNGSTDWTIENTWTIGDGVANGNGANGSEEELTQSFSIVSGKTYKVVYDVLNYVSGAVRFQFSVGGTVSGITRSSDGTFTEYVVASGNHTTFKFRPTNFNGSITNISVKEVGQNWTIRNAWSIETQGVRGVGAGASTDFYQLNVFANIGKLYKYSFEIIEITNGEVQLDFNNAETSQNYNTIGVHTGILNSTGGNGAITFRGVSSFSGLISNISVIEITTDTSLPRINYEGFSYQDALGSELITNGNDTSNIVGLADNQNITIQTSFLTIGKTYKIDFEIYDYVEGSIFLLRPNDLGVGSAVSANGNYTYTVVADASTSLIFRTDGLSTTLKLRGISVKEYLGQEPIPNSGCGHWLWEPQSTNLIEYSSDFSQWTPVGTPTITSNYGISPDGTQNSTRVEFDANERIYFILSASGDITFSVYLKGSGIITLRDNTNVYRQDVTLTSEWARYDLSFNATITSVQIQNQTASVVDCEVWGAQAENLTYSTSLIPTEGTTVTRNQDVCTNGGSLASINSTEGVLYAEIAALADDLTLRSISLSDGTTNNVATIRYRTNSNRIQVVVFNGGVLQFSNSFDVTNILDFNKVAISYNQSDFNYWVNGVKRANSTSGNTPIGMNKLSFDNGGSHPFFGKTKAVAVWKEALSNEELTELTTI